MSLRDDLPKRSITNAFLIWRVPRTMPIELSMLLKNIAEDIETASEECNFDYAFFSRREKPERSIKFLLQRNLLTREGGLISRNARTKRYVDRLPAGVVKLVDRLPIGDPLTLLAGAGDE